MERKVYLLSAICITLTLLTGCSARKDAMAIHEDSMSPVAEEENISDIPSVEQEEESLAETPSAGLKEVEEPEYTVAEICAGFREDWSTWKDLYDSPRFFWVTIKGRDYYYEDTYPSSEWTVDEVMDYYREHYYYWGDDPEQTPGRETKFYLWMPDYEHQFMVDTIERWLYIDRIKAAPLDTESYSMNPKDLVEAFQNREWDGEIRRYSDNFSTYVKVVPEYGLLKYGFQTTRLSKEEDPLGLAYTGYLDVVPW